MIVRVGTKHKNDLARAKIVRQQQPEREQYVLRTPTHVSLDQGQHLMYDRKSEKLRRRGREDDTK
jgi:hypothetical protein